MLARCSPRFANRLLPGRVAVVTACGVRCSGECAAWLASDISALLFPQKYMRGGEEAEREKPKHERIEPEIGKAQSLGEGTDADRLKPGRRKHQADGSSGAGKGGDRYEQTGKVHDGDDGKNGGCKDCRYLGPGEGRDDLPETTRGENVEQSPEHERSEGPLDRHVENEIRHQHHEGESQHP